MRASSTMIAQGRGRRIAHRSSGRPARSARRISSGCAALLPRRPPVCREDPGERRAAAEDWPIDGTVGYDFLAKVNRLWMDDQRIDALTATYADFTGHPVNFGALVREKKRAIVESTFSADLDRLERSGAERIARADWRTRDLSPRQLREALARVTTALAGLSNLPHRGDAASERRASVFAEAVQSARIGSPEIDGGVFDFLAALFAKPMLDRDEEEFIAQWQQLSPAVMAKGVEDTTFYLLRPAGVLQRGRARRPRSSGSRRRSSTSSATTLSERWPNNLLATSTHDNKRSEDVRTRISLLSEIPDRWAEALHQWSQLTAPAWRNRTPDRHAEYLLYQTLIGAWPHRSRALLAVHAEGLPRGEDHAPPGTSRTSSYEENIRGFVEGVFETAGVHRESRELHRAADPAGPHQFARADAHQDDRAGRAGFLSGHGAVGSESRRSRQPASGRFRAARGAAARMPRALGGGGRRATGTRGCRNSG